MLNPKINYRDAILKPRYHFIHHNSGKKLKKVGSYNSIAKRTKTI